MISFTTSAEDARLISMIVDRTGYTGEERLDIEMDITATHANGCPLDLAKLLNAPQFDFMHDVVGIASHLNRTTGGLERCFRPRCAMPALSLASAEGGK